MQNLRLLLFPFSAIYWLISSIRNFLFQSGMKSSYTIPFPSICIGNITVGGTGKSPLTIYIAELLQQNNHSTGILSRGYGRSSKGLVIANNHSTVTEIGDEPLMYWNHFEYRVPVVVAEQRKLGVEYFEKHQIDVLLLDDAFQHRAVKAGLNIVLMPYKRPNFNDFVFPVGNLREPRKGIKRADAVVITKCPEDLSEAEKSRFYDHIPLSKDTIFFSTVEYGPLVRLWGEKNELPEKILLVTAIAHPEPLNRYLATMFKIEALKFNDHQEIQAKEVAMIVEKVATFAPQRKVLVTTQKDAVKLIPFKEHFEKEGIECFVQTMSLSFDRQEQFNTLITSYVTISDAGSC